MLVCSRCNSAYSTDTPRWRCDCGSGLDLQSAPLFNPKTIRERASTLWRYREALGVSDTADIVTLGEGYTPLVPGVWDGTPTLFKVDFLCPTGSYKDRGSAAMISKLKEWGIRRIIEDSSGNAGASIAAYAGMAGIQADIYVPESTSAGKAAQIAMYGANLVRVPGTREDTASAAWKAAQDTFYASHNWSPYFLAGLKTAAYEIAEQLDWQAPDWVVTPVGNGGLLVGLALGFADLVRGGILPRMPRIAAAQAENCDPIYRAWRAHMAHVEAIQKRPTAAEGISVAKPVRGDAIMRALRDSDGVVRAVSEEDIWGAVAELSKRGFFVEPTSATAPAVLSVLRREGTIASGDSVVVMLTGNGLKATDKIVDHYFSPELAHA